MKNKKHPFLKVLLFAFFFFIYGVSFAQEEGIHFEHGLTWKEVKEKAKRENKFIFMDCYTTWCGPCKVMSKEIFPQKSAGDFFNPKFINVKVQFDQTAQDNEEVKKWYADAEALQKEFNVLAYPTFLYFSPEGELVHLFVGSTKTAEEFIDISKNSLDTATQYYTKVKKILSAANGNPEVLKSLVMNAINQYDGVNSAKLADMYLRTQSNLLTKENLTLLNEFTKSSSDYGFDVFINETAKVNALMGQGFAQKKFTPIINEEENTTAWLSKRDDKEFADLYKKVKDKYPAHADLLMARLKINSYQASKNYDAYMKNIGAYVTKYGKDLDPIELSGISAYVSVFSKDPAMLNKSLTWISKAYAIEPTHDRLNIKAGVLYKLGKKKEAIAVQKEAIEMIRKKENKYQLSMYEATLLKMEKGEPTL